MVEKNLIVLTVKVVTYHTDCDHHGGEKEEEVWPGEVVTFQLVLECDHHGREEDQIVWSAAGVTYQCLV